MALWSFVVIIGQYDFVKDKLLVASPVIVICLALDMLVCMDIFMGSRIVSNAIYGVPVNLSLVRTSHIM